MNDKIVIYNMMRFSDNVVNNKMIIYHLQKLCIASKKKKKNRINVFLG